MTITRILPAPFGKSSALVHVWSPIKGDQLCPTINTRNARTYLADAKSLTGTSTAAKPVEMQEARKLRSLVTAVILRVRLPLRVAARGRELAHQHVRRRK